MDGELKEADMLFHECPSCSCRCNCHDQPCSCCNSELKEAVEWVNETMTIFPSRVSELCKMLIAYHHYREENKWVSVEERLPEETGEYEVVIELAEVFENKRYRGVSMSYYNLISYWMMPTGFRVIFWRPKPQPPKE